MLSISLALSPAGLSGCSWSDRAGTHSLVLGVGVVSSHRAVAPPLAAIERTRAAGLLAAREGLVIGLLDRSTLAVAPAAQLLAQSTLLRAGQNTLIVRPLAATCAAAPHTTQEVRPCVASPVPCCLPR